MASDFFCKVEDGVITAYNVPRPTATDTISFGMDTTDDEYRDAGFWPVAATALDYNPATQTQSGVAYSLDPDTRTVIGTYTNSDRTLEDVLAVALGALAVYRYTQETNAFTYQGNTYACDEVSQGKLTTLYVAATAGVVTSVDYKTVDGFVTLTAQEMIAVALTGLAKVQAAFTNEKFHSTALSALTTTADVVAYDFTTGWAS